MSKYDAALVDIFERYTEREQLTLEAERELIRRAKDHDEEAVIGLLYAYGPLLRKSVGRYRYAGGVWAENQSSSSASQEDLRSGAVLALLEAVEAFDFERWDRLAAILPQITADELATALVGPVAFSVPSRTLKRFYSILRAAKGNVYEAAALAPSLKMTTDTFLAVHQAVRKADSLDAFVTNGSGQTGDSSAEVIGAAYNNDNAGPVWDGAYADVEDAILVETAFQVVDTLEKDVIRLAYGFSDYDPVPDAEIGERLGFSRPKVQRVRASGLAKMRVAIGA
jgi:DNA-directed RNA polymerase specialized sigma subunit